jgi:CBS domain-containing protein
MKVRMLMNHSVITAQVTESLHQVAARMRADGISALPVLNRSGLVGIVTERDLVAALADGLDTRKTQVSACMTPEPVAASPDDQVTAAALQMVDLGVRHLPVVEAGRVVGILSARDLMVLDLLPASWIGQGD